MEFKTVNLLLEYLDSIPGLNVQFSSNICCIYLPDNKRIKGIKIINFDTPDEIQKLLDQECYFVFTDSEIAIKETFDVIGEYDFSPENFLTHLFKKFKELEPNEYKLIRQIDQWQNVLSDVINLKIKLNKINKELDSFKYEYSKIIGTNNEFKKEIERQNDVLFDKTVMAFETLNYLSEDFLGISKNQVIAIYNFVRKPKDNLPYHHVKIILGLPNSIVGVSFYEEYYIETTDKDLIGLPITEISRFKSVKFFNYSGEPVEYVNTNEKGFEIDWDVFLLIYNKKIKTNTP